MPLLESTSVVSPATFAVGPVTPREELALIKAAGVTILHAAEFTPANAEAALKSLRGFRTSGRRVVWCNATDVARLPAADLRGWGRKIVDMGGAQVAAFFGSGGRELAVAARDAGLPLSRVVVCRDDVTARNVLCDSIIVGDVVLALGVTAESCRQLAERLESKFEALSVA